MSVLLPGWTRRAPCRDPYTWLRTAPGELLAEPVALRLAEEFPESSFARADASGRTGDKTYRNYTRSAVGEGGIPDTTLPASWQALVGELTGDTYRRDVASLLGQREAGAVDIRLVRHGPGDWLSPHTDRDDKLFSHIIYFNPGWRPEWGGCLEILRSQNPAEVFERVVPTLGASALVARSNSSWHQVSKVVASGAPDRKSLLIHGLR